MLHVWPTLLASPHTHLFFFLVLLWFCISVLGFWWLAVYILLNIESYFVCQCQESSQFIPSWQTISHHINHIWTPLRTPHFPCSVGITGEFSTPFLKKKIFFTLHVYRKEILYFLPFAMYNVLFPFVTTHDLKGNNTAFNFATDWLLYLPNLNLNLISPKPLFLWWWKLGTVSSCQFPCLCLPAVWRLFAYLRPALPLLLSSSPHAFQSF